MSGKRSKIRDQRSKKTLKSKNILSYGALKKFVLVTFVIVIAGVGTLVLGNGLASGPTPTSNMGVCGARISGYNYTRPFGQNAAWNVPVCKLKRSTRSTDWSARLWNYADTKPVKGQWGTEFGIPDPAQVSNNFGTPVYTTTTANTEMRVRHKSGFAGRVNIPPDGTVPFNKSSWRPSDGSDAFMAVRDPTTGREWNFWSIAWDSFQTAYNHTAACYNGENLPPPFGIGYNPATDLCVGSGVLVKDPANQPIDYRTYEGNYPGSTGIGLQMTAGLVMPEEVEAGEIRHALKMSINNTVFGPECPRNTSPTGPELGNTCGTALSPAGQFESAGVNDTSSPGIPGSTPDERRKNTVPIGTRYAIDVTDAEIDAWINSRGYSGEKRRTAQIFAVALREYGFIIAGTSKQRGMFYISSAENTESAKKWNDLGIGLEGADKDFLYGLFKTDDLYSVEPSTNVCKDGTSSYYYCHASKTYYPDISSTPEVTLPSVNITNPVNNSTQSGTISLQSSPTSSTPVTKVEYYIDNKIVGTATAPYVLSIDTRTLTNGVRVVKAKAFDASNNSTWSADVNINISNLSYIAEDINQDGKVNLLDFSALKIKYGQAGANLGRADINQDGKVNLLDFSAMSRVYGYGG